MITKGANMVLENEMDKKPEIEYPIEWGYKLIGRDSDELQACIAKIMGEKEHTATAGHASKTGKFHSYNTKCIVQNEGSETKSSKHLRIVRPWRWLFRL